MRRGLGWPVIATTLMLAIGVISGNGAAATTSAPARGAALFTSNCSTCHGADGKGIAGAVPPLAGNAVVVGDPAHVIHIVKNGLEGRVVVLGTPYDGRMPAWKSVLSPTQIATVITYIRSTWGNRASAVSLGQVNATK